MVTNEERTFAVVLYVLNFFAPVIGPLIIWLIKKDESAFIDYHGKEYFNFMISYFIYSVVSGILVLVLIGALLLWVLGIAAFIFNIIAAVKAYEGQHYRFPLIFRLIK
ncbi:DUF4870 domain-containing protein [Neobacillus niacini]|uniref:DUF4870 domain-containing protein n=1 Tax=Neobacillus niacini TaxID=86668 RepID=UPI0021CB6831|nr:DUF4870 domain-containing protein [Neobacillus niacini]MCM3767885.1 DUF4870 domain-containing protein [Neobacillus niacini]